SQRADEQIEGDAAQDPADGGEQDDPDAGKPASRPADTTGREPADEPEPGTHHGGVTEKQEKGTGPSDHIDCHTPEIADSIGDEVDGDQKGTQEEEARVFGERRYHDRRGHSHLTAEVGGADELPDLPWNVPAETGNEPDASERQVRGRCREAPQDDLPDAHTPREAGDVQEEGEDQQPGLNRPSV